MKTQLICFALLALISFISAALIQIKDNRVVVEESNIISEVKDITDILEEFEKTLLNNDKDLVLNTIDFSWVYIKRIGYWDLIESIDSFATKMKIPTISVIFDNEIVDSESFFDNINAEIAIVTEKFPNVVTNIKDSDYLKNYAYKAFKKMHNTKFDETLTVNLPSFEHELNYILDFLYEYDPFVVTSNKLYDYIFAGVNFSKVKSIRLFHFSLFDYFYSVDFPNLEELIFDFSVYDKDENGRWVEKYKIFIKEYVDAVLKNYPEKTLYVYFEKKASEFLNFDSIMEVKSIYKDRITLVDLE